jgi:hypothetical protein
MPEDFDTGATLIPGEEEVSVDDRLKAALDQLVPDATDPPKKPYGRGWAFDFNANQFVAHGSSPAQVFGLDELRMWIEKTLNTARLAHVIYSDQYGVEEPFGGIGQQFTPALAGLIASRTKAALMVHDRITDVRDFEFTAGASGSQLFVSFTVVTDDEHLQVSRIPVGRTP